jgi:NAD(P)-dependent dehydrogenase (short-subunit alcohol dehydrogenase family)
MTTTLITGANKGLGFETARRLIDLGHTVYLGARDAEKGAAAAESLGARFVQIDVTDDASVAAAAASILEESGQLDVLVNNAGISGSRADSLDVTADLVREVYDVNVFGIVRVTHAMLPLLQKSQSPVIVNVSSGLGSFSRVTDPAHIESGFATVAYGSSKAATTMVTVQYAKAFPGMRVNAADPGYTATDLNGNSGTQTVTEGTDAIVQLATIGSDGPTGTFVERAGVMPW